MHKTVFNTTTYGEQYYFVKGTHKNIIVLIHGFAEDATIYDGLIKSLCNTYTIININLPGSGHTAIVKKHIDMEYLAMYVQAVINDAKAKMATTKIAIDFEKIIIAGHSMGGYIALAYSKKYPEQCAGISLINSTIYADDDEKKANRLKALELIHNGGKDTFLRALIKNLYDPNYYIQQPETISKHLNAAQLLSEATISKYYHAMMHRIDSEQHVSSMEAPLQIIVGNQDAVIPLASSLQQSSVAKVSFVHLLQDSGHTSIIEKQDHVINYLLTFAQHCYE